MNRSLNRREFTQHSTQLGGLLAGSLMGLSHVVGREEDVAAEAEALARRLGVGFAEAVPGRLSEIVRRELPTSLFSPEIRSIKAGGFDQLGHDVRGCGQVRIAHAQVDDVLACPASLHLQLVDGGENIGR